MSNFASMLSKKTKYAINALVYLAKNNDGSPIPIGQISADQKHPTQISRIHIIGT